MVPRTMVLGAERVISGSSNATRQFPQNPVEFGMFERVTFQLLIQAPTGSPTDWSVVPKFQWALEHSTGAPFSAAPVWKDFSASDIATFIVGGADWATIGSGDSYPRIQQRTLLRPPNLVRVILTPSYTGGSSPSNSVTALAVCS